MAKLPVAWAWVINPSRRWFACCDRCERRRLVANYYEVYGDIRAQEGWWWECAQCLIETITDYAERKRNGS